MGAKRSLPPLARQSILAIRSGALGDTLLTLPALAALREAVGREGAVELVGRPPAIELALGERLAGTVHSMDRARFRAFYDDAADASELLELIQFLGRFDVVVAWSRLPRLRPLVETLGTRCIEADPLPPEGVHASDHMISALEPLGIGAPSSIPEVPVEDALRGEARELLRSMTPGLGAGGFVAIHPSSGSPRKNWPPERFRELAAFARAAGLEVLWIEGEADEEAVRRASEGAYAGVARHLPLKLLAAVLSEALAFVGNDSGVTHLAAACSVPTIAIFGPTDPRQWAPRGRAVTVVDWHRSPALMWGFTRAAIESH